MQTGSLPGVRRLFSVRLCRLLNRFRLLRKLLGLLGSLIELLLRKLLRLLGSLAVLLLYKLLGLLRSLIIRLLRDLRRLLGLLQKPVRLCAHHAGDKGGHGRQRHGACLQEHVLQVQDAGF